MNTAQSYKYVLFTFGHIKTQKKYRILLFLSDSAQATDHSLTMIALII